MNRQRLALLCYLCILSSKIEGEERENLQAWDLSILHCRISTPKSFTPSILPNFNSFSDANTKKEWTLRNLHRWQKIYTAAGNDGRDKSHLWENTILEYVDYIEYISYIILIDHQERLLYLLIYLDISSTLTRNIWMICFTFLKGVLPIFCWTGHGSEVKRTNCNQVLMIKSQNEKSIFGKSLHWIEHRIFRGKRCIVETAL